MSTSIISYLKTIIKNTCNPITCTQVEDSIIKKHAERIPQEENSREWNIRLVAFDVYGTILHSRMGDILQYGSNESGKIYFPELSLHLNIMTIQKSLALLIRKEHEKQKKRGIDYPEVDIITIWRDYSKNSSDFPNSLSQEEAMICSLRFELHCNPVWRMPHAEETLISLQKSKLNLGIISNAQFYTPIILATLYEDCWDRFSFLPSVWSYKYKIAKPSQQLYRIFLQQTQYDPSEILYIGNDKRNDIFPAKKLGMKTLLYAGDSYSFRPRSPELDHFHPSGIISSLENIPQLLRIH